MMMEDLLIRPSFRQYLLKMMSLCKVEISLFSTFSAVSGYFLISPPSAAVLVLLASGVFFLAAGAGALNHYQERRTDALMDRTARRPLPSGIIKPGFALWLSVLLIAAGTAMLLCIGSPTPPLLGLAAVFWYNGFYTWFKTMSPFAAIPGALVGTIPPAIGWMAGGGNILDLRLAVLCFFFFMWQVLHFMVHILTYAGEYEKAGLPCLSAIFTEVQIKRLAFQWLLAVAAGTMLIGLFDVIHSPLAHAATVASALWLAARGIAFIGDRENGCAGLFREINYYILLVMTFLTLDGYLHFSAGLTS